MPTQQTTRKAKEDLRQGYSPSTAAGEFVHEEMHHKKQRKHGTGSRRQAIAIGLSKARKAGIPVKRHPTRKPGARSRKATARPARRKASPRGRTGAARNRNAGRGGATRKGRSR